MLLRSSYRQMVEVVLGLEPGGLPEEEVRAKREYVHAAKRMAQDAELARLLRSGVPLTDAVVELIRARFTRKLNSEVLVSARALCHSLHDQPETRTAGAIGGALVARHAGTYDLAWDLFSEVPRDIVARNTPVEFLRTAAQVGDLSVVDECVKWIDQGLVHGAKDLFAMASIFFAVKEHPAASRAIDAAREAGDADERLARRIELLADFTARAITPQTATVPQGRVSFAVIDYKAPDENVAVQQHRRHGADHREPGPPAAARGPAPARRRRRHRARAVPRRPGAPRARGARAGRRRGPDARAARHVPAGRGARRTPGCSRSAGTCTASSTCGSTSRSTRTCSRCSCRST